MKSTPSKVPALSDLTPRQLVVLHWLAEGKSSYETSIILACSLETVKKHRCHIYKKLDVANAVSAASFYWQAKSATPELAWSDES